MTPERRTNIVLLSLLAIMHLSMGTLAKHLEGMGAWVTGIGSVISFAIMFAIYWRFNRDSASLLQTISYWAIIGTFLITQRIGEVVDRTDSIGGTMIRLVIIVPIYIYIIASGKE
jgi:hypothetical protein